MAIAIIEGGPKGHPHAPLWYKSSPVEPIGKGQTVTVKDVAVLEKMTLEGVLDQIIASKPTEVVIVSHGEGDGLLIPFHSATSIRVLRDQLVELTADHSTEENINGMRVRTPVFSNKQVADDIQLKEDQVKTLRAKMKQVQAMKLKHVAFRACNMGIHVETLQAFREFFGAASVSAPKLFDSYGEFTIALEKSLEAWVKAKRHDGYHISVDKGVAFGTKDTDNALVYTIVARGESENKIRAWVRDHIVEGGWNPKGVIFHGMKVLHVAGLNSPTVFFVKDAGFVGSLVRDP